MQTEEPDFWNNRDEAVKISQQLAETEEDISFFESAEKEIKEIEEFLKIEEQGDLAEEYLKIRKMRSK
jgi:hypothetical protein